MEAQIQQRLATLQQHIIQDNEHEVRAMLSQYPDLLNRHCSNGWTPLIVAAWHGSAKAGAALVAAGADVNLPNHKGTTPLMYAKGHYVVHGGDAMMRVLLAHGADRDAKDMHGLTVMEYVPDARKTEVLRILDSSPAAVVGSRQIPGTRSWPTVPRANL